MRIRTTCTDSAGRITGYRLSLSARDTYDWAHKCGGCWPGSTLSDQNVVVEVDSNGLCDFPIGEGGNVDGHELEALIFDHLPAAYRHLWPVWDCNANPPNVGYPESVRR